MRENEIINSIGEREKGSMKTREENKREGERNREK